MPNNDNPRKEENIVSKMNDMAQIIEELRTAGRRVECAAVLALRQGEIAQEVFIDFRKTVLGCIPV